MKLFSWFKKKQDNKNACHHPTPPMEKGYMHSKLQSNWQSRMNSTHKRMSEGAQEAFRVIKCRCHWGSKNLWGRQRSNHHRPK